MAPCVCVSLTMPGKLVIALCQLWPICGRHGARTSVCRGHVMLHIMHCTL